MRDIEQVSKQALRADLPVAWDYMTLEQAKEWGAIALFGETYDNTKVRVVEIGGPWSRELCGGTHVDHSSQIGTVVVTGEASVGSGNRRIEAFTGVEGFDYLARERDVVAQLTGLLKTQPDDLVGRVQALVERLRAAEKEVEKARVAQLLGAGGRARCRSRRRGTGQAGRPPGRRRRRRRRTHAGPRRPRPAAAGRARRRGRHRRQSEGGKVVRGRRHQRRGPRARAVGANELVRAVGPLLGGKGGGKDDVAQGGGSDTSRIDEALALVAARGRRAGRAGLSVRFGVRVGIDPGDARIGVARSDPSGFLATPVETVRRGSGDVRRIAAIVAETEAIEVVVGLPRSLCGREGPAAAKVREFAARLARRVHPLPVRLCDERLTTVSAESMLREQGRQGRQATRRGGPGSRRADPADCPGHRAHERAAHRERSSRWTDE